MTLAGLSIIVAGSVAEVSVGPLTVRWRQLVGLSYALFAVLTPLSLLPSLGEPSTLDLLLLVSSIVGGLTLLYIGYDVVRGGEHFSMTADVDTEIGL
jgi:membrane associated rhomboid family serine protease